jgi:predicted ArsR family transcriptional regulator
MKALTIEPNMGRPDDFYEALVEAHHDLSDEQSQALNAALILLLANHVGELEVLRDALRRARKTVTDNPPR